MENPVVATVLADTVPAASEDRAVRVEEFTQLRPRAVDDPQRLYSRVMESLDYLFSTRNTTYLSGQREALSAIVKAVLDDGQTGIFAVPLVPGGGKSTVMRALLTVFAEVFRDASDPVAQRLGGVIVVVEKTAEGDELEQLCNNGLEPGEPAVARLISSTNDYNLQQGKCLTGSFHHFVHAHFHKAHPVLQATAIFVFPMIGIGRKKLADQIAVTGMYFHCIHSGFARQMNCLSERFCHSCDFGRFHSTDKGRGIDIETAGCGDRPAPADVFVRHVSAMSELYGGGRPFFVDGIGDAF